MKLTVNVLKLPGCLSAVQYSTVQYSIAAIVNKGRETGPPFFSQPDTAEAEWGSRTANRYRTDLLLEWPARERNV